VSAKRRLTSWVILEVCLGPAAHNAGAFKRAPLLKAPLLKEPLLKAPLLKAPLLKERRG